VIIFKTLSWRNFLSTGNYKTVLDLRRHNNTLVSGDNGAGKSTMLDALTFALFGKSFRGINIPQLPNSINNKDCEVEITFSVGKNEYKVLRSLKPKKFEIYKNNELLDQSAKSKDYQKILEEQILKMTYKSFCQVVILGSSNYVPFMQLSASDRRSVVENLLDIDIFSVMNGLVKGKAQLTKDQIKEIEYKIILTKNKAEEKEKLINSLEKKSSASIEKYKKEIQVSKESISKLESSIDSIQKEVDDLFLSIPDKDETSTNLIQSESEITQLNKKIKNIQKSVKFYEDNDSCPTCKQDIQQHHKESVHAEKEQERSDIDKEIEQLNEQVKTTEDRLTTINSVLSDIQEKEKQISSKQSEISALFQYVSKMEQSVASVLSETTEVQEVKGELTKLAIVGRDFVDERKDLIDDRHYYNIASLLLKDSGIKSKIIKHYLPIMNRLINKYLLDMDFFCQFNLDENFNETIKSRHRDEFTYHSFSEGERLRIDLSLLLAWREVARLKNSVNCNLLILDEVFDSSLDGVGTEEFLKLLTQFGDRANIFVISHKSDSMTDKFQNHIVFQKKNNFSRIK
tara:strand:+ start:1075 stop:2787 length:1713 start_codon:yes stop_codon:yes gene_type:complete